MQFTVICSFILLSVCIISSDLLVANDVYHDQPTLIDKNEIYLAAKPSHNQKHSKHGFQPRPDLPAFDISLPLDWSIDPYNDRNWQFQLHAWRMIDPIISTIYESPRQGLFNDGFDYIEDWYRYHIEEGNTGEFSWYDMAVGIRAMRLAFFMSAKQHKFWNPTSRQTQILVDLATIHARRLQEESFITIDNNHGLFQVFGLNLLCETFDDLQACDEIGILGSVYIPCQYIPHWLSCPTGQEFAKEMFTRIMNKQFTPQGIHREHSPDYHKFAVEVITKLGGAEKFQLPEINNLLGYARNYLPWMVFPNRNIARIGDSSGKSEPLDESQEEPSCTQDDRCYAVGEFTSSGYAIIRSNPPDDQSMLIVIGMAYSNAHKHADDLSFELLEYGRHVFVDSGKYGYEHDQNRRYVLSAAAHNTISLRDKYIAPDNVEYAGSLLNGIESDRGKFRITGAVERPGLFHQEREINYEPEKRLVIRDRLTSENRQHYVSSLHLAPDLHADIVGNGFVSDLGNGHQVSGIIEEKDCIVDRARGERNPLLGWVSRSYLEIEPTTVVFAKCPGDHRTITWHIEFE